MSSYLPRPIVIHRPREPNYSREPTYSQESSGSSYRSSKSSESRESRPPTEKYYSTSETRMGRNDHNGGAQSQKVQVYTYRVPDNHAHAITTKVRDNVQVTNHRQAGYDLEEPRASQISSKDYHSSTSKRRSGHRK